MMTRSFQLHNKLFITHVKTFYLINQNFKCHSYETDLNFKEGNKKKNPTVVHAFMCFSFKWERFTLEKQNEENPK